jgi:hypothetical protein
MMTQVKTQLTALLVILLLNSTPLSQGLNGTPCSQGSCFAQLPELCGSVTPLPSAPAAALSRLCGGVGDFPYKYDYDPANTSRATFAHYFSDADKTTPVGFARAVLEASFDAANAELGSGCNTTWEAAGPVLQIRAARRFAARTYMLAAETTLDMANVDGIGDLSADAVLSLLLNRTVSGARGFCGFCGVWLARLLNDVVLPSHTKAAAVPLFLANNYPGYPASGGLTHVLNTVPTVLPETGEVVYATQDAYFSYEFVRCDDRHTPLDLREILRAIIARNASDVICVPFPDDRLYFPRLEVAADHVNGNATVELQRTWGAWAQVADKSAPFGAWVNRTLALFGCPTADDDGVGNFYYYLLVPAPFNTIGSKQTQHVAQYLAQGLGLELH